MVKCPTAEYVKSYLKKWYASILIFTFLSTMLSSWWQAPQIYPWHMQVHTHMSLYRFFQQKLCSSYQTDTIVNSLNETEVKIFLSSPFFAASFGIHTRVLQVLTFQPSYSCHEHRLPINYETQDFPSPYRIVNHLVCNGCYYSLLLTGTTAMPRKLCLDQAFVTLHRYPSPFE